LNFIKNKYYVYIEIKIRVMADLENAYQFFGRRGGNNEYDVEDDDQFTGGNNNFKYGGNDDADNFFAGGGKKENERSFTVHHTSIGTFTDGRFISASASGAAKKAASAIFRRLDIEMGFKKNPRNAKPVSQNSALKTKYGNKRVVAVSFVLLRIDRKNPNKYYAYDATREVFDRAQVIERAGASIKITQKIDVKKGNLSADLHAENKAAQKKRADVKRKARDAEAGVVRKPRKAAKAAKKAPKAAKAAKGAKKTKAAKKASPNKLTINDIIKSLSKSPVAEKPKKVKAAKKPKAAKKTKGAKKTTGGGYCSFF
jgi:hypothetical protein